MWSIETTTVVPLEAIKPFEALQRYRARCLDATKEALRAGPTRRRERSPAGGARLEPCGDVDGLAYVRCPATGSLFLAELPSRPAWRRLLEDISRIRHSPEAFHTDLAQSRTESVYAPKLEWLQDALRLQALARPRLLEVATAPSHFTPLLTKCGGFTEIVTVDEMALVEPESVPTEGVEAAVLLESLDRVDDPEALLRGVAQRLISGGLLFVTALVASGFDVTVLGLRNRYLYPPDRANCFSRSGLAQLVTRAGFVLLEVSTPGVLDVEIVLAHLRQDPTIPLSRFERQLLEADPDARAALQSFLQQQGFSSFARVVARKT